MSSRQPKKRQRKGLGKLQFYCQMCEKQCIDQNGMANHIASASHAAKMKKFSSNAAAYLSDFSARFRRGFVDLLKRRPTGGLAVQIYDDYIRDKDHVHMNATKWTTLSNFVKDLAEEGVVTVEEGERGLHICFIDRSKLVESSAKKVEREQDEAADRASETHLAKQIKDAKAVGTVMDRRLQAAASISTTVKKKKKKKMSVVVGSCESVATPVVDDPHVDDLPVSAMARLKRMMEDKEHREREAAERKASAASWLREGLFVRVVSSKVKSASANQSMKNLKAVVTRVDLVSKTADVRADDDIAKDVPERRLETIVPKAGKRVRILVNDTVSKPRFGTVEEVLPSAVRVRPDDDGTLVELAFERVCRFQSSRS